MTTFTKIAWTDHTTNPWWGCQATGSPGCANCYAEALDIRTGGKHFGPKAERRRTSAKNRNEPLRWNKNAKQFFATHGRRQRVFGLSMGDFADNQVPSQWRMDLFTTIANTPELDWLLLTKRIGNVMKMCQDDSLMFEMIATRVKLGITVCNQEEADRDIPKLLQVPAAGRFLSMEPLLGPVDLGDKLQHGIGQVIVGGESGRNARPVHPAWVRSIRDQCVSANVPFFFKQWGEWAPGEVAGDHLNPRAIAKGLSYFNGSWIKQTSEPDGHADDEPDVYRVGVKAAGRVLDGRTWDEFPV